MPQSIGRLIRKSRRNSIVWPAISALYIIRSTVTFGVLESWFTGEPS